MGCFLIVTAAWIFSVCLHEFGHAWVAWKGGDYTIKEKGYLTFNPFRYTHPVYSIVLPVVFLLLGGIGLPGGAVYVNTDLLRSRKWQAGVALAGPAMNLALIILLSLAFRLGIFGNDPASLGVSSMTFFLQLQVSALLLNLLPVPPLDGFQALAAWLPQHWRQQAFAFTGPAQLLLFVLLANDTVLRKVFWNSVYQVSMLAGADPLAGAIGYLTFKFWQH